MIKTLICALVWSSSIFGADLFVDWIDQANFILRDYVVKGTKKGIDTTLVDYYGLRNDPNFRKVLYVLARLPSFDTLPRNDQIAMWINAYNILAINIIIENPGIKSIRELNSMTSHVWTRTAGVVAGQKYSLEQIEKEILVAKFQDPRIHFAINRTSLSSPDLANYAYQGAYLDEQLNNQMKQFLQNPTKGMKVLPKRKKIQLSKIFDWNSDQFSSSPKQWIYKQELLEESQLSYSVSYMDYNWSLNSLGENLPRQASTGCGCH